MQLFYASDIQSNQALLTEEESHHCMKVLRLPQGSVIQITDGRGHIFEAVIRQLQGKNAELEILRTLKTQTPKNYFIHIALAPTKQIDRTEWFIEKSVEIGIQEITMLLCENSERKQVKIERLEKIAISAMKQSGQIYLPKINALTPFQDLVGRSSSGDQKLIAYVDEKNQDFLGNILRKNCSYCILIGPEGDFSTNEIMLALNNGFQAVSLGKQRYRTETAGLVACHISNLVHEM
ncbi:MAG: 16S rRNA (uracil(1498)-N(3))-methyltransferase [Microscillaceae bacterium]|nr:16S rRNA (uracil(1498)-N(3))-methyltransferase [Microscillaceae bacterium]